MDLNEKRLLLTGACGGIGRGLALDLAKRGARLVLSDRDEDGLKRLADQLPDASVGGLVAVDLLDAFGRASLVDQARSAMGGLDGAILLAGGMVFDPIEDCSPEHLERLLFLNLTVPVLLSQALLPILKASEDSRLVFVGSILGSIGMPFYAAYGASKAGIERFAESLGREMADSSVSVSFVAPRAVDTGLNDARARRAQQVTGAAIDPVETVTAQIVRAIEADAKRRYLGWPERFFVKLNALLPSLVDGALVKQGRRMREVMADARSTG